VSRTELVAWHNGKGNFREVSQYNQRILLDMHQFMKRRPSGFIASLRTSHSTELLRRFASEVRGGGELCDMGGVAPDT
jgi:hypothetical protein